MIRVGLLALIVAGSAFGAAATARGQGPQPDNEDARFTFHRTDDGYLRLDGRSGQVSICVRRPAGWLCQAIPDERSALESEIVRLQSDNAALKKELLAHGWRCRARSSPNRRRDRSRSRGCSCPRTRNSTR